MFEGEVIEVLPGGGKFAQRILPSIFSNQRDLLMVESYLCILFLTGQDRRCKYLIDGFVEDLSVADLRILAQLEADNPVEFGKVGYRFRKQFNEGWFDGIVVKVLSRGGKIYLVCKVILIV